MYLRIVVFSLKWIPGRLVPDLIEYYEGWRAAGCATPGFSVEKSGRSLPHIQLS